MRYSRHLAIICSVAAFVFPGLVQAANADEILPPGVFHMADGNYYHIATGHTASTLSALELADGISPPDVAPTSSPPVLPTPFPTAPSSPSTSTASSTTSTLVALANFPLKQAIYQGRALLQAAIDSDLSYIGKVYTADPDAQHITLAIWDPKTNAVHTYDAMKSGVKLTPDAGQTDKVRVTYSNGLNSDFRVTSADGDVVVAIRYSIYTATAASTKKKPKYSRQDVVYTPYSPELQTPQMVAYGQAWLNEQISEVYASLRATGVPSRSLPSRTLADVISPELTQIIMTIEHTDQVATTQAAQNEVDHFYVTLAANEDSSYDFSRSSAGALGLVQFIPSTYKFVASLPHLGLTSNFETGMRKPTNAIKAEVAYLDYLLAQLPKGTASLMDSAPDLAQEYIAAAYNGGAARVKKAMAAWDMNLSTTQRVHVLARSRLKVETMDYVLKLRQVRTVLRKDAAEVIQSA